MASGESGVIGQTRTIPGQHLRGATRLRAAALCLCLLPALWLGWQASHTMLGPRPFTEAIHQSGDWAIRLLWLTLLVTPLRRILNAPRLIAVRQSFGLAAFGYAVLHVALYVVDQKFDAWKILSEIALRYYLTIGFAALLGLTILAATSGAQGVRRLGSAAWNRLHKLIYLIAFASVLHFYIQAKLDVSEPILMTGLLALLMGHRALVRHRRASAGGIALLALAAALATLASEVLWYRLVNGIPVVDLIAANIDFEYEIKAMWWVLATGLVASGLQWTRGAPQRQDAAPQQ